MIITKYFSSSILTAISTNKVIGDRDDHDVSPFSLHKICLSVFLLCICISFMFVKQYGSSLLIVASGLIWPFFLFLAREAVLIADCNLVGFMRLTKAIDMLQPKCSQLSQDKILNFSNLNP